MSSKDSAKNGTDHIAAQTFSFRELATATRNFRAECLLGEGGFGRVYKGRLESINQVSLFLMISLFMKDKRKLQGNEVMVPFFAIHHFPVIHVALFSQSE